MCVLFQIQSLALDVTFVHVSQTFYSTLVIKWGYFYTALERPFSIGVSPPPIYIIEFIRNLSKRLDMHCIDYLQ